MAELKLLGKAAGADLIFLAFYYVLNKKKAENMGLFLTRPCWFVANIDFLAG